jgi:hypothetical protein
MFGQFERSFVTAISTRGFMLMLLLLMQLNKKSADPVTGPDGS